MSIVVNNVSKSYGNQKALHDVSFEIKPGEIVGFLGPNGAGKSTMMKIITAYLPANEGTVEVCGIEVNKEPIKIKRLIGYLAEQNPLYYDMYVKEFLHFTAGVYKLKNRKEKIDEIIEKVGLGLEKHKKIGALSKGYKQRVGIAQAMLHDPEVLILDEPTSGLDPNQLKEIRDLIKQIGAKKTVMLSTHIMQEVEAICDRIIIINRGKIVANDTVNNIGKIIESKNHLHVEFEDKIDKKSILAIEGINSAENVEGNSWSIQYDKSTEIRNQLFNLAVKSNTTVLTLQKTEAKLEDVFKKLTAEKEVES